MNLIENANQITTNLKKYKNHFFRKKEEQPIKKSENLQDLITKFESEKSFETLSKILTLSANNKEQLLLFSTKGLELFPAQAFVYLMNAKALNMHNKFKNAIEQLEAQFYEEFSISYSKLGNPKEAIKNKNKALALRKK